MSDLHHELAAELAHERFDLTPKGVYFPRQSVLVRGEYRDRVNGGEWRRTPNLVVDEGILLLLNVALGAQAKPSGFYIALFSGTAAPQPNWTAASFPSAAGETVSMSEGYTSPSRPAWTPAPASGGRIDSIGSPAQLTFATAAQVTVTGAAVLTSSVRGGTTGTLVSAVKYDAPRVFQNGDTFDASYSLSLTV
jgi:hypothetical protein